MKKANWKKNVSKVELLMYELEKALYRNAAKAPEDIDYDTWRWQVKQAVNTVAWYVATGRASGEELAAILKCRLFNLLRHMALTTESYCEDSLVKAMHTYSGLANYFKD